MGQVSPNPGFKHIALEINIMNICVQGYDAVVCSLKPDCHEDVPHQAVVGRTSSSG